MRKIMMAALALVFLCGALACKGSNVQIRMATGGTTGTYFTFGTAVGKILSENTGIPISVQSTGASKANIQLIGAREVEIAIVQNDAMDCAWYGVDLFSGQKMTGFSCMAALYDEACQIVVNRASGINSIADLKGKNISVGDVGSSIEYNARHILETYGIAFNQIGKHNLGFGASTDALRSNTIDAFFCIAGAPTPAIMNLAEGGDIVILEIDDEHANLLINKHPFYTKHLIPAGSYQGQNNTIQTIAVRAAFIVSSQLSGDLVYELTKSLFESKAQIEAAHIKGKGLSPSFAIKGISVPFHPGALRYFREIGIL